MIGPRFAGLNSNLRDLAKLLVRFLIGFVFAQLLTYYIFLLYLWDEGVFSYDIFADGLLAIHVMFQITYVLSAVPSFLFALSVYLVTEGVMSARKERSFWSIAKLVFYVSFAMFMLTEVNDMIGRLVEYRGLATTAGILAFGGFMTLLGFLALFIRRVRDYSMISLSALVVLVLGAFGNKNIPRRVLEITLEDFHMGGQIDARVTSGGKTYVGRMILRGPNDMYLATVGPSGIRGFIIVSCEDNCVVEMTRKENLSPK